ncbi:MAG: sigma-70 family RNA polymerase sigma factor [Blastocatellia bacterium]
MKALVKLLECLDPNLEIAGEKYEDERRKLIRYFERRGVISPDELADITLDRVAQKLEDGEDIVNIGAYCYTAAHWILKEYWRRDENNVSSIEDIDLIKLTVDNSVEIEEKELSLNCLDLCLKNLSLETRDLIVEYYRADRRQRIKVRQAMANRLGINREALSNRMQRLRKKLEECIENCQAKKGQANP